MPTLQIRDLPDDIYQRLSLRAQRAHRSLAQQALSDLLSAMGQGNATGRRALLTRIVADAAHATNGPETPALTPPERLIREDRER
jgi:plasmid stability protein